MSEPVLSIDDGGVCVITLNRPSRLNAINAPLLDGLNTALARRMRTNESERSS